MNVWEVPVIVGLRFMPVHMTMRLFCFNSRIVYVLVMLVMHMLVIVDDRFVSMPVFMLLCEMEPYADSHENTGAQDRETERLLQEGD